MKKKACFMVTDCVSFNVLCKGQLEYLDKNLDADIWFLCGGSSEETIKLKQRAVGRVIYIPFQRKPSIFKDLYCLLLLVLFFSRNRFDMIVYSTPKAMLLGAIASSLCFQRNRVALVRGRAYENFAGFKRHFFAFLDKLSLHASHKAVFISTSLQSVYERERIIPAGKGVVLAQGSSNGVDTNRFQPGASRQGPFRVVSVGRVCADKGVEEIFEVFSLVNLQASNVEFEIVGSVEDECAAKLLANSAAFDKLTYIPHEVCIEDVFQRADLHLFLSHREGFGNVALESAACGVPTFAYDVVGVQDSVAQGISGLRFKMGETKEIADAIISAAADPDHFRAKYSSARNWAATNFSQRVVWEAYAQFYSRLIK